LAVAEPEEQDEGDEPAQEVQTDEEAGEEL
jgi:hypothetical protein